MKKKYFNTAGLMLTAVTFLGLNSCRSNDTEQSLQTGGVASVKINLTGTDYAGGSSSAQASLKAEVATPEAQRNAAFITPSMLIETELKPSFTSVSAQASTKLNTMAENGTPIGTSMKFRVIAYRNSDGSYQDHKDYTVGQPGDGLILDQGAQYNIVAYSYGTTSLPAITSGETSNINNAQVLYDNANPDFMYQKQSYTPNDATNTLGLTLRHKVTLVTTTVNSLIGNITSITGGFLSPHNTTGTIPLVNGIMTGRGNAVNQGLNFTLTNGITAEAAPVFLNANTSGNLGGTFSANITVNGTSKTLTFNNSFKITPEYKSDLVINLRTCGAYLGPNQTQWTEFACQNLGATATAANAFNPIASNHGLKVQWGRNITGTNGVYYVSQATDQSTSGPLTNWSSTLAADGAWNSGTEANPVKTANDPCPSGYRVPTRTEGQALLANNIIERVGSWSNNGNYTSALYFKNPQGIRTLMLPAAGRRFSDDGSLDYRGNYALYWSSTIYSSTFSYDLLINPTTVDTSSHDNRGAGFSVRCIKDSTSSNVNGGNTSWNSSGNINITTTY
ncbi:hypothetical protein ATB96_17490 [Elizabethkingia ursingii]|nr:hypothetical protein ATB96_17490 [Elizabethkingia ursingii]